MNITFLKDSLTFQNLYYLYENAAECPAVWAGMNAASQISIGGTFLSRQHFRRGWKASAK